VGGGGGGVGGGVGGFVCFCFLSVVRFVCLFRFFSKSLDAKGGINKGGRWIIGTLGGLNWLLNAKPRAKQHQSNSGEGQGRAKVGVEGAHTRKRTSKTEKCERGEKRPRKKSTESQ